MRDHIENQQTKSDSLTLLLPEKRCSPVSICANQAQKEPACVSRRKKKCRVCSMSGIWGSWSYPFIWKHKLWDAYTTYSTKRKTKRMLCVAGCSSAIDLYIFALIYANDWLIVVIQPFPISLFYTLTHFSMLMESHTEGGGRVWS